MAFITEVKPNSSFPSKKKPKEDLLGQIIRKDYVKLQSVVKSFSQKVDVLVDKQRAEYMHAYEHHMIDVQRELHNLREKATAIANDTTREEKIKKLDSDQKWFRNEAMRLDVDTNVYRKKMRDIKVLIQSTERERDWLLEKLRTAKAQYKIYKYERSILVENGFLDEGRSTTSNDSSYTLELRCNNGVSRSLNKNVDWRGQMEKELVVSRNNKKANRSTAGVLLSPIRDAAGGGGGSNSEPLQQGTTEEKMVLGELVAARAKQDGIKDFVAECSNNSCYGTWSQQSRRPTENVLQDCVHHLDSSADSEENRRKLISELCLIPEVYFALAELLSGKPAAVERRNIADVDDSNFDECIFASAGQKKPDGAGDGVGSQEDNPLDLASDVVDYFERTSKIRKEQQAEKKRRV